MFVSFRGKRLSLLDNLMIHTNISPFKKNFPPGCSICYTETWNYNLSLTSSDGSCHSPWVSRTQECTFPKCGLPSAPRCESHWYILLVFFIRSSCPQYYSIFSPQKHLHSFSHLNKDSHFVAFAKWFFEQ